MACRLSSDSIRFHVQAPEVNRGQCREHTEPSCAEHGCRHFSVADPVGLHALFLLTQRFHMIFSWRLGGHSLMGDRPLQSGRLVAHETGSGFLQVSGIERYSLSIGLRIQERITPKIETAGQQTLSH